MTSTSRETVSTIFFFSMFCIFLGLSAWLLTPFFGSLLAAAILAIVFHPMHRWIGRRWMKKNSSLQALASTVAILLFFLIPLGFLLWAVSSEMKDLGPKITDSTQRVALWAREGPQLPSWLPLPESIARQLSAAFMQLRDRFTLVTARSMGAAAGIGTKIAASAAELALDVALMLIALFFFLRDGPAFRQGWNNLLPLPEENRRRLEERVEMTVQGVVKGTFITCFAQAVAGTIGYLIVGAPAALVLGFLTFMAGLIPSVGTALVWAPMAVYFLVQGPVWKGIVLMAWGVLVIGLIDNIVRPYAVGRDADLPFFWLFFGILGGLQLFGFKGLFLGPVILAIMPVLFDIYRHHYLHRPKTSEG